MVYKVWIGKRESDILTYEYFEFSITFYGSNSCNNESFCTKNRIKSNYSNEFLKFVVEKIDFLLSKHHNLELHFYNNIFAYKVLDVAPYLKKYIVNLNLLSTLNYIRHKALSRLWLSNFVNTPAFCLLSKYDCYTNNLKNKFCYDYDSFIIQRNFSGGGSGTYKINQENEVAILNMLDEKDLYLVSPFYTPNKSLSCHVLIDDKNCIIFPLLEQKLYTGNFKLEYRGNVPINPKSELSKNTKLIAKTIAQQLQNIGYRGICGFDFILFDNMLYLIEINPRFQGSSHIINLALKENLLPSLFELNCMSFKNGISKKNAAAIDSLEIKYSGTAIEYLCDDDLNQAKHIMKENNGIVFLDGFNNALATEKGSYLLRYISLCDEI